MSKANEQNQALKEMVRGMIGTIHTCCPGHIISFDGSRASVQPDLKYKTGDGRFVDFPVIVNVPVIFPSSNGGSTSITFPLKKGDGVELHFAERSLDDILSGGESDDPRRFDLTDAIATPGFYASGVPASKTYADDMCLVHGGASIRLTASGEIILSGSKLKADISGNIEFTGQKLTMDAKEGSSISGGDLVVNGVSVVSHTHKGVIKGTDNTGEPNGGA